MKRNADIGLFTKPSGLSCIFVGDVMKKPFTQLSAVILVLGLASVFFPSPGCVSRILGDKSPATDTSPAKTDVPYNASSYTASDRKALVESMTAFGFDFFHGIASAASFAGENILVSPYSIENALAMTWAGAENKTAEEMARALRINLSPKTFHSALNGLNIALNSRDDRPPFDGQAFQINLVNAVWSRHDYPLRPTYLEMLGKHYNAGIRLLDFVGAPAKSREEINQWVEQRTKNKIKNLLPPGAIKPETVLVLTNAVYFKASWYSAFNKDDTFSEPFTRLDGTQVSAEMMHQQLKTRFHQTGDFDAVELPYVSPCFEEHEYPRGLSMLVIIPRQGNFEKMENKLNAKQLNTIVSSLKRGRVKLALPKFEFEFELGLKKILKKLGLKKAFAPARADFSGLVTEAARPKPYLSEIYHKAFITVDEKGTEAAAATASVMAATAIPSEPVVISADRSFLFFIRDDITGTVLFMGRVLDPVQAGPGRRS